MNVAAVIGGVKGYVLSHWWILTQYSIVQHAIVGSAAS